MPETAGCSEMCDVIRKFSVFVGISALLIQASYAQSLLPDMQELPKSSRQKAAEERKKAEERAADDAYNSMMKQVKPTKSPHKKFDPWGGVRAPSANR